MVRAGEATAGAPTAPYDVAKIKAQLDKWRERLLDLSGNNPLVALNRSRVTKLRVSAPDAESLFARFAVEGDVLQMPLARRPPKTQSESGESPLDEQPQWEFIPGDLTFDVAIADLAARLKRLYDNARTTVEERGVTTLYLTFGVLRWTDPLLGESVSPLWMVPCAFERTSASAPLKLAPADEEAQVNPALALFLRDRHKIELPPLPDEPTAASYASTLAKIRAAVSSTDWKVEDAVWVSTFSFESLAIYNDLQALVGIATQSKLIAALARAGAAEADGSEALGEDLDGLPRGQVVVPVLPTDSSQLEALGYAAAGRHLVVHGPPGTGKSQTISALIADALGRGQKVLFVSAKMAALDVVHRRLSERGLGDFCLEAHSTKGGKAKIIEELRRTLEADPPPADGQLEDDLEALVSTRRQLNDYVAALHAKQQPLGLTAYQGIGKVARLGGAPELRFNLPWTDPLVATRDQLAAALDAIANVGAQSEVFDRREQHPWRGFVSRTGGVAERERVESDLETVIGAVTKITEGLRPLEHLIPAAGQRSLGELEQAVEGLEAFASVDRLPTQWRQVVADALGKEAEAFEEAARLSTELGLIETEFTSVFNLPPAKMATVLAPITNFASWHQRLAPSYWNWRSSVKRTLIPGNKFDRLQLMTDLERATRAVTLANDLAARSARIQAELPGDADRGPAALASIARRYRAAQLLRGSAAESGDLEQPTPTTQSAARQLVALLPSRNAAAREAVERLAQNWANGFHGQVPLASVPLEALLTRATEVAGAPTKMDEWILLERAIQICDQLGLRPFFNALGTVSAREARRAFERRFYTLWTSAVIAGSPVLAAALGARREELVTRFRSLDDKIRVSAVRHIRHVASEPARRVRLADRSVGGSEIGILNRELQKRRAIKPLRRLFADIPHVLQAIKPCMLMSPVSVSTYLQPGALEFDLVVFDEASQLPTQEAIPSILRARQVVVAGDVKQLPPSSFFSTTLLSGDGDDDDGAATEPLESLLDDCVAIRPIFQESNLRWHYRSRDERLIRFSNHYFYDDRLHTFPSASLDDEGKGVHHEYVADGIWARGKDRSNPREARRVAQLVVKQLEIYPDRSIGVVAMNVSHRDAIDDALHEELAGRPELTALWDRTSEEPNFVKSLEAVQGDERDTMIISVGYGHAADGSLTLNFGPLNLEGGWRRLNVLVTRAKWQTILVTSLRSDELRGVNPNNRGAMSLRNFIAYAEQNGQLPQAAPTKTDGETNDFEDSVREALVERGLVVDAQVGASRYRIDLAIRDRQDPGRYVLGVECDGATYHGSRTARDRDLLRQQVLRDMGWRLHRLWSTDWFRDPQQAIAAILRSVEQAEAAPLTQVLEVPAAKPLREVLDVEIQRAPSANHVAKPEPAPAGAPYVRCRRRSRADRNVLMDSGRTGELVEDIISVVTVEGPIYEELLIARLKEMHGVDRAASNIRQNIANALAAGVRKRRLIRSSALGGTVFTLPGATLATFRTQGDGVARPVDEIPPQEIVLAILHLVSSQFGMQRERIATEVASLFGFDRAGATSADHVREVVDDLIENGGLRTSGPNVSLP